MKLYTVSKAVKYIKDNKYKINNEFRLNYHFMGEYGWINDPNGFIFYKKKYHLFYQHYPYASHWGSPHWGHALSSDLIKWDYLPTALAPDMCYDDGGCFSGSSIERHHKLYLMYTGNAITGPDKEKNYKQTQCIAYSSDEVNFTKYSENPVINTQQIPLGASKKDFRDPNVFKKGGYYYAVIGSKDYKNQGQALLYKSRNLYSWKFINIIARSNGDIGSMWECPNLFSLNEKDILIVSTTIEPRGDDFLNHSSSIYMIGEFDYRKGELHFNKYYPVDYGFDFYSPQTNVDNKNRRIMIAWMDMWGSRMPTDEEGHNWAGAMTLPREIVLKGNKLYFKPIEEIKNYREDEFTLSNLEIEGEVTLNTIGESYELEVIFDSQNAKEFGLMLRVNDKEKTVLYYNKNENKFIFNRDKSGIGPSGERKTEINLINNQLKLHVFVDISSVEVFINDGEKVMSGRIYPNRDAVNIKVFSIKKSKIVSLKKWAIKRVVPTYSYTPSG